MPTQFSSAGVSTIPASWLNGSESSFWKSQIQKAFDAVRSQFAEIFAGLPEDTTEENMQPRLRGLTLMALRTNLATCS
jgi:NH3-dependent NAD+ synthetase